MDYRPLNPVISEIRLITLLPNDGSAEIRCKLDHVSLTQLPRYAALSYFWGNPDDTREITLDGKPFQATANLYHAFVHLRSKGVSRLWVDAICINQRDTNERNQQILLMRPIYQRAREVIAWVGTEYEGSDKVFDLIERKFWEESPSRRNADSLPSDDFDKELSSFLQREYWSRVWIIQEIVLARVVTIHCGRRQMNWKDFVLAFTAAAAGTLSPSLKQSAYGNLEGIFQLRHDISESKYPPLLRALYHTWMAKSTDTRDKVFGVIGLASDATIYVPAPNYMEPVEDLCRAMTLGAIFHTGNLDILPLLGRGSDDPSVISGQSRSWIPFWHSLDGERLRRQIAYLLEDKPKASHSPLFHDRIRDRIRSYSPLFRDRIRATGHSSSEPLYDNGILTCQGMLVGHVEAAGHSILDEEHPQLAKCPDSSRLPNPYGTKKDTFCAIYCTFLCIAATSAESVRCFSNNLSKGYLPEVLRIWRSSYHAGFSPGTQAWIDEHRNFMIHGRTIESWAHWMTWTYRGLRRREKALRRRKDTLPAEVKHYIVPDLAYMIESGMRLILTNTGHIGWAHPRWKTGDKLYLLKGCSVPVILRPREEGGFLVVGDAYIQGFMNGEAMKDAAQNWVDVDLH